MFNFKTPPLTAYFRKFGAKDWKAPERIVCAAVWYRDGKQHSNQYTNISSGLVVAGLGHHNCLTLLSEFYREREYMNNHVSGFLTSHRRFVNRSDGWKIAEANGQILYSHGATGTLYSEDLFD